MVVACIGTTSACRPSAVSPCSSAVARPTVRKHGQPVQPPDVRRSHHGDRRCGEPIGTGALQTVMSSVDRPSCADRVVPTGRVMSARCSTDECGCLGGRIAPGHRRPYDASTATPRHCRWIDPVASVDGADLDADRDAGTTGICALQTSLDATGHDPTGHGAIATRSIAVTAARPDSARSHLMRHDARAQCTPQRRNRRANAHSSRNERMFHARLRTDRHPMPTQRIGAHGNHFQESKMRST